MVKLPPLRPALIVPALTIPLAVRSLLPRCSVPRRCQSWLIVRFGPSVRTAMPAEVIIVEIVVVGAVADVQGGVVEGLVPTCGSRCRALAGQVDRTGAGAGDAGQRQPVREVDVRELVVDRLMVPS